MVKANATLFYLFMRENREEEEGIKEIYKDNFFLPFYYGLILFFYFLSSQTQKKVKNKKIVCFVFAIL